MARRQKTSPIEDMIDIVSMLPWWAGAAIAVVSYIVLHRMAVQEIVVSGTPGQIGTAISQSLWKGLATGGQYIVPIFSLCGAAISAWKRHQRKALIANVSTNQAAEVLNDMSWREFEMLVGEAFRLQGYEVAENESSGPDGGIDLVLRNGGETFLVQCKQWKAYKVGVQIVRELYGVMAAKGAAGGFVVTSGRFTDEATSFATGRNLKLVDGPALQKLIRLAQASRGNKAVAISARNTPPPVQLGNADPVCPVCSKSMVRRTAKRGANSGGTFWGCSGYPACKGTRPA